MIGVIVLTVYISRSLLVVFGALVFAAMIDGGARLLGRILPIARAWRVALVLILSVLFFVWLGYFAGSTISSEAAQFPRSSKDRSTDLLAWAQGKGLRDRSKPIGEPRRRSITSGIGTVTSALGGFFGGLTTIVLILIIGIYVAVEPKLYERGVEWMMPRERRDSFHVTVARMAHTLRRLMAGRLLGMFVEGVFTYLMLAYFSSAGRDRRGADGISAGDPDRPARLHAESRRARFGRADGAGRIFGRVDMGIYTIAVYLFVQNFDGYVIIPMIAKKTVDLAPALVLAAQLVMGVLFGILGIFLADPLLAMLKVALERRADRNEAKIRRAGASRQRKGPQQWRVSSCISSPS